MVFVFTRSRFGFGIPHNNEHGIHGMAQRSAAQHSEVFRECGYGYTYRISLDGKDRIPREFRDYNELLL